MSKSPLRIAYCLPKITGGADLLQQMLIAQGLQERGHDLTFIAPYDFTDTIYTKDIQIRSFAPRTWSRKFWFKFARKSIWEIQQRVGLPYLNVFSNYCLYDASLQCLPGHDIVQERNGLYKMGIAMACKRLRLPYILFFDADDILEHDYLGEPITGILRWRAKRIIRYSLVVAGGIICVSNATKNRLVDVWKVKGEKIAVFPNGVNVHQFRPQAEKRAQVRSSFGLQDQPIILYVGGFYLWHDVRTLLDAFSRVLKECPQARLLLVGDGKQRSGMIELAKNLGVEHAVQFPGSLPQTEIPGLINAADIAVAPYPKMDQAWWGSSMKLFEYMASGVAIVASDVGQQVSEVIRNGENGLLVKPGDVSGMAEAILQLIKNVDLRANLGQRARKEAVASYSWEYYLSRLECVYEAVINQKDIGSI